MRWKFRSLIAGAARRTLREEIEQREKIIDQQLRLLETRNKELHDSYVHQQQTASELQRRVHQITTLYETGLDFTSTLDRTSLVDRVLDAITQKLGYDSAMVSFYDPRGACVHDTRVAGVAPDFANLAGKLEVKVTDENSLAGSVFLKGITVLVDDVTEESHRMHPLYKTLATMANAKSFLSVPLRIKALVLGSLTVNCVRESSLNQDDLQLMSIVANQLAIAFDNSSAYCEIENLNLELQSKIYQRTAELEVANEHLKKLLRSKE